MRAIDSKKRIVLIIVGSALVLGIIVAAVLITSNKRTATQEKETSYSAEESTQESSDNVFTVKSERDKSGKIRVVISLEQNVSICTYKLGVRFDSQYLKLLDYDNELSLYSPTVNPEKKGNEIQWERGANDVIEMTWASAKNCTANGDIISMEFEVVGKYEGAVPVTLAVEDIGVLNESSMVVKPAYKVDYNEE